MIDSVTAVITSPVDIWWNSRDYAAALTFGTRKSEQIIYDPLPTYSLTAVWQLARPMST